MDPAELHHEDERARRERRIQELQDQIARDRAEIAEAWARLKSAIIVASLPRLFYVTGLAAVAWYVYGFGAGALVLLATARIRRRRRRVPVRVAP